MTLRLHAYHTWTHTFNSPNSGATHCVCHRPSSVSVLRSDRETAQGEFHVEGPARSLAFHEQPIQARSEACLSLGVEPRREIRVAKKAPQCFCRCPSQDVEVVNIHATRKAPLGA